MLGEHVQLLERASVQQQVEPLARGELALLVLRLDALLPAAEQRLLFALAQVFELLTCRLHLARSSCRVMYYMMCVRMASG